MQAISVDRNAVRRQMQTDEGFVVLNYNHLIQLLFQLIIAEKATKLTNLIFQLHIYDLATRR